MTVWAAHQMGRDSSILTCITHHFTWRYIILWRCFSERESLDLNLQQHRAVQTLLNCFSKPSTPDFKVLSLWGAHSLPAGQDILSCYRTWGFITMFTTVCHWSYPGPDESGAHLCICLRSILLLCSCLCWSLFLQGFLCGMLHMFSSFWCM